jgi:chromosome segregation ATPase
VKKKTAKKVLAATKTGFKMVPAAEKFFHRLNDLHGRVNDLEISSADFRVQRGEMLGRIDKMENDHEYTKKALCNCESEVVAQKANVSLITARMKAVEDRQREVEQSGPVDWQRDRDAIVSRMEQAEKQLRELQKPKSAGQGIADVLASKILERATEGRVMSFTNTAPTPFTQHQAKELLDRYLVRYNNGLPDLAMQDRAEIISRMTTVLEGH